MPRTLAKLTALLILSGAMSPTLASESVEQAMLDKVAAASGMPAGLSRPEICSEFEELARGVMSGRQNGVPMSGAINNAGNNKPARLIVEDAYEINRFHSDKMKRRAIEEFSTQQYRSCYQALAK